MKTIVSSVFLAIILFLFGDLAQGEAPPMPDVVFVSIPGGSFRMGDERGDIWNSCGPVHEVTVSGFRMSDKEITNALYCEFLNTARERKDIVISKSVVRGAKGKYRGEKYLHVSDPSFQENRCRIIFTSRDGFTTMPGYENWPVVRVTWFGAKAFAEYYGWDIPSEAEWEYACRGGKQLLYGTCDGTLGANVANCVNGARKHPVDVGSYPPNPWGLFDMTGNVWEWCNDWYGPYESGPQNNPAGAPEGIWRIMRGGGWTDYEDRFCRSATRYFSSPNVRSIALGFRVVQR